MIDKKTLNEIEWLFSDAGGCDSFTFEKKDGLDIIELARLGLWARDVAKPALEFYADRNHIDCPGDEPGMRPGKVGYDDPPEIVDYGERAQTALQDWPGEK